MVWNDTLKRDIPLGWHVSKLSEICSIVLGGTPSTSNPNYWNGNIDWLNSGEVSQFPVIKSSMKISKLGLDNSPAKLMPKGTTVVSITGNIRSSILAIDASANQSVVGILESNSIRCPFIYPYIDNMLDQYSRISTGNCQQHINKGTIEDSIVVVPDEKILAAYYSISQPIYDEVAQRALECFSLTNLRDWLLPMLMNGQATITD